MTIKNKIETDELLDFVDEKDEVIKPPCYGEPAQQELHKGIDGSLTPEFWGGPSAAWDRSGD